MLYKILIICILTVTTLKCIQKSIGRCICGNSIGTRRKNGYVYIASFGSYLKSMAWSVESDKGFSLGHMKKKYFVENLYKKNSISVQYNPDLMYLNSERLTNNLASESWSSTSSYPIAFGFYGNNAYRMKGKYIQ